MAAFFATWKNLSYCDPKTVCPQQSSPHGNGAPETLTPRISDGWPKRGSRIHGAKCRGLWRWRSSRCSGATTPKQHSASVYPPSRLVSYWGGCRNSTCPGYGESRPRWIPKSTNHMGDRKSCRWSRRPTRLWKTGQSMQVACYLSHRWCGWVRSHPHDLVLQTLALALENDRPRRP